MDNDKQSFSMNQNLNIPSTNRFPIIKIVFIVLGLIVVGEVIWAVSNFLPNNSTSTSGNVINSQTVTPTASAQVSLSSDKTSVKVGDKITVAINVSANKSTDGTDLIINFDPELLTVDIQNAKKAPVTVGQIYSDYPVNSIDSTKGNKIIVSGIAITPDGVTTNGIFGTINLVAKAPGTATLKLEFSKGSTADTNVTESGTGKDILDSVQDLTLNIAP